MFQRILISTDFSEASGAAISKGIELARLCGADVEVVHVVSDLEESLLSSMVNRARQIEWEAELETKLDLALPDEAYPGAKKSLLWGPSIPGEILQHAIKEKFDLIVCGSHGRGLLARTFLGSVVQELSRNSAIPILAVPPKDRTEFSTGMKSILVPIDFSLPSLDALAFAIRLTDFFKSAMILLHAIYVPAFVEGLDVYPAITATLSAQEELKREATARLKQLMQGRPISSDMKIQVIFGEPAHEILEYASENKCSCVVMGSHGRKGLERAILGSVTTSVLAHTNIPVFTIAPRF